MIPYNEKHLKNDKKNIKIIIDNKENTPLPYQLWAYNNFIKYEEMYISKDFINIFNNYNYNYKILPDKYKQINFFIKKKNNNIIFTNIDNNKYIYREKPDGLKIIINGKEEDPRDYQIYAYYDFIKYTKKYSTKKLDNMITIPTEYIKNNNHIKFTIKKENEKILFIKDNEITYYFIETYKKKEPILIENTIILETNNNLINFNNAILLYSIYKKDKNVSFPKWILDYFNWNKFKFNETIVLYDNDSIFEDVKNMVKYRHPINIGMDTNYYYDDEKLLNIFNYKESYYMKSTLDNLKPNIAIYCHASVKINDTFYYVHIINLVGYAFDIHIQPDFIYYENKKKNGTLTDNNIKNDLILRYRKIWLKACIIAKKLNLNKIVIYNVGGGAFTNLLSYFGIGNFTEEIFINSFYNNNIHSDIITPKQFCLKYNINIDIGFDINTGLTLQNKLIPNYITQNNINTTLYVNAWDPHSILGNGNESDNTLDGYWGRCSNISVLGWEFTNNKIKYNKIEYK